MKTVLLAFMKDVGEPVKLRKREEKNFERICSCTYRKSVADELAKEGSFKDTNSDSCLTFSEIASSVKQDINAL